MRRQVNQIIPNIRQNRGGKSFESSRQLLPSSQTVLDTKKKLIIKTAIYQLLEKNCTETLPESTYESCQQGTSRSLLSKAAQLLEQIQREGIK